MKDNLKEGETGLLCETAHPAKFKATVESSIWQKIEVPQRLADFMKGEKQTVPMKADFNEFKKYLMNKI